MKKKFTLALAGILLVTMSLVGCASTDNGGDSTVEPDVGQEAVDNDDEPATDGQGLKIGFVPMTLNNEFFITMVNGAQQKADELGIELVVQAGDQHASASDQLGIIENMITSGVDAICIVPSSSEGLLTGLQQLEDAGIPVINIDTKLTASLLEDAGLKPVPFYGTDNYKGAILAGEYVKANYGSDLEVAILTGMEGQQNAADRRNGFVDGAGDTIIIKGEQTAEWEVDKGYVATQNMINANPDIKFVFASNDGMAIGAVRAIDEAQKADEIKVIGFDAISEALNMVEDGTLLGTVAQYPGEMGIMGVQAAFDLLNGKEIEMDKDTGAKLITKDNVAEFKEYMLQFVD